jgi:hypothetical protein
MALGLRIRRTATAARIGLARALSIEGPGLMRDGPTELQARGVVRGDVDGGSGAQLRVQHPAEVGRHPQAVRVSPDKTEYLPSKP